MATIALYSNQIAQMSGKLGDVKKTVGDYKSELFSLKSKALAIKQSICNMEDVISSIQAATSVQEEKVDSLEQVRGSSEQFIEDTYRIDGNVAELVNKRKDDFYDQYKYLKPDSKKNLLEEIKDRLKKGWEWCKEHWKGIVTVVLVIAAIIVIAITVFTTVVLPGLLVAMAIEALIGAALGGVIGGVFSRISGGSFWEGFKDGAFYGAIGGAIGGAMSFVFTGVVWGAVLTLKQLLLIGGVSAIGSVWVGDLGDIVLKGVKMSLKEIVIDVVVAGVTGVVFAGIFYGLSKAFKALKLKIVNKGGKTSIQNLTRDEARDVVKGLINNNGEIELDSLMSLIPDDVPNTFNPTDTIKNGGKYEFTLADGQKVIIRWHEPDPIAASKYPGCVSGSRYTAQIKIGNKQLKVTGDWTRNQSLNEVHIPIEGK